MTSVLGLMRVQQSVSISKTFASHCEARNSKTIVNIICKLYLKSVVFKLNHVQSKVIKVYCSEISCTCRLISKYLITHTLF